MLLRLDGRGPNTCRDHPGAQRSDSGGTFATSLFPAVRLGYLSLPQSLVEPATHAKWLTDLGRQPCCSAHRAKAETQPGQSNDSDR